MTARSIGLYHTSSIHPPAESPAEVLLVSISAFCQEPRVES